MELWRCEVVEVVELKTSGVYREYADGQVAGYGYGDNAETAYLSARELAEEWSRDLGVLSHKDIYGYEERKPEKAPTFLECDECGGVDHSRLLVPFSMAENGVYSLALCKECCSMWIDEVGDD